MKLLEFLARESNSQSLAVLSRKITAPKSSMLQLIRPLADFGYLKRDSRGYRLGGEAFRWAAQICGNRRMTHMLRPCLEHLARDTGETVYLAVLNEPSGEVMYADGIISTQAVHYWVPLGTRRPVGHGAAGMLFLAFTPTEIRDKHVRSICAGDGEKRSLAALRRTLDCIRRDGLAVSLGEAVGGAGGIAVPVFAEDSLHPVAALVVAGPVSRIARNLDALKFAVRGAAAKALGNGSPTGLIPGN